MSDDENSRPRLTVVQDTPLAAQQKAQLPAMGGMVNRWLDHFRTLDNEARTKLVRSLADRFTAEGQLVDAYVSFEKKKRQLLYLNEILDDEDEELKFALEEKAHKRELRRRERERELNPPEPEIPEVPKKKKHRPRKSRAEILEEEAEQILRYGTPDQRGAIFEAKVQVLKEEYGEDETQWPEDLQEYVRRLRLWKMKDS